MEGYQAPETVETAGEIFADELNHAAEDINIYIEAAEVSAEIKSEAREVWDRLLEEARDPRHNADPAELARYSLAALQDGVFNLENREEQALFDAISYRVLQALHQVEDK